MIRTIHGKVHGKTIQLDEDPGVAEGQEVEIQIKVISPAKRRGEGILRTAGALVDDPEWDRIMEEVQKSRKIQRSPQGEFE